MTIAIVEKIWGEERVIVNEPEYCLKYLHLKRQFRCSYHFHPVKKETFYINSGTVLLEANSTEQILRQGDMVTIPPMTPHRFMGIDPWNVIMEISTHDDPKDSIREDKSARVPWEEFKTILKRKGIEI